MEKKFSKLLSVVLSVLMLITVIPFSASAATVVASGECGENLTWTLDSEGLLTISGTGNMYDYSATDREQPWAEYSSDITKVIINDGITGIGTGAFFFLGNATEISVPDSVKSIGPGAFNSTAISAVNIPQGITRIEDETFYGTRLKEVTIPDSVTYIGDGAFRDNDFETLDIPDSVTYIGAFAFCDCNKLTEVKLPKNITSIEAYTFAVCSNLGKIVIPDSVTSIGETAFLWCPKLTEVKIPYGVTEIGYAAFSGCTALSKAELPDSITHLGPSAFYNCPLPDISIPDSVIYFGAYALGDITQKPYYLNEANWVDGVLYYGKHLLAANNNDISRDHKIKEGTTTIYPSAFSGCSRLSTVEIPESVVFIGAEAFADCTSLSGDITISKNVKYIDTGAFNNTALRNIYVEEENTEYVSDNGILYNSDKTQLIKVPAFNTVTSIEIPYGTTVIEKDFFKNNENLEQIIIPETVTEIKEGAFDDCSSLKAITIPESTTKLHFSFYGCNSLSEVTILNDKCSITHPDDISESSKGYAIVGYENSTAQTFAETLGVLFIPIDLDASAVIASGKCGSTAEWQLTRDGTLTISGSGYCNCSPWKSYSSLIKKVVVKEGIANIYDGAFYKSLNLTDVTLPSTLNRIGSMAFYLCDSLKTVTMPEGAVDIGEGAFENCESLESITIGHGSLIRSLAFFRCSSLSSVTMGKIELIAHQAFDECSALETVYFRGSLKDWYRIYERYTYGDTISLSKVQFETEIETKYKYGAVFAFGSFPQSIVEDASVIEKLNNAKAEWVYVDDTYKNTKYAEIELDGNKYRAVLDENYENAVNWFIYEPIFWRVIDPANGLIFADIAVDKRTASSFATSDLRKWLNNDFYSQAFSASEASKILTETVNNISLSTYDWSYTIEDDTVETIFIPSEGDLTNRIFGFSGYPDTSSSWRQASATDYLLGRNAEKHETYPLHTRRTRASGGYFHVNANGYLSDGSGYDPTSLLGIRPAMYVDIENIECNHVLTKAITDVTCTSDGYTKYSCRCGYSYTDDVVSATGHSYASEITTAPTHLTEGIRTYTCSSCGDTYTENIAKLEKHTYVPAVTAPTCTNKGYTTYTCECTDSYVSDYVDATGHSYSDGTCVTCGYEGSIDEGAMNSTINWRLAPDGTLIISGTGTMPSTNSGSRQPWYKHVSQIKKIIVKPGITKIPQYSFEYCEYAETVVLPETLTYINLSAFNDCGSMNNLMLPASLETIIGNGALSQAVFIRCESLTDVYYMGTSEEWRAATSNNFGYSEDSEMTLHLLQYKATTATCTQEGIQAYYQFDEPTVYGPLYDDNKQPITQLSTIPALGHDLNAVVTAPTCEDIGFTTYTCTSCSYTYTADKTAATGHKHTAVITVPTCTEQGYTTYTCKCGDSYISDYKNATGHSYRGAVTKPATHLTEGVMTYTCICGDSYTKVINKIAKHTYKAVITAPTCTEQGYTTYTCECGDSYISDYKNATGHNHKGAVTTPATHLTEGIMTYTCICGDSYTEAIAKLEGHTYTSKVIKQASHLEEGEAAYTCECGDSYTEAIKKLPGHTYETAVTAPTCTEQGFTTYTCACGDSYTSDYVKAKGHSYVSFIETEPGCKTNGTKIFECECGYFYTEAIPATGHRDNDNNNSCDNCGVSVCDHMCHKSGFMGFIWKIINFFGKLFGSNPVCECGAAHY